MKRTPLRRKTPLKGHRKPKVKRKPTKRTKLPAIKTMWNKCDKLLTPIIKAIHPRCILQGATTCNTYTQVAHHHVHKSTSSRLRYELENLIPLCHACHIMLHQNESYWASRIVVAKGLTWFSDLESKKNEIVKTDVHWYIDNYERLRGLFDELSTHPHQL